MDITLNQGIERYLNMTNMFCSEAKKITKSRCLKLFSIYVEKNYGAMGEVFIDEIEWDIFEEFFILGLPELIYQDDDDVIDGAYGIIKGFCAFSDMAFRTNLRKEFLSISQNIASEYTRVIHVKKDILEYTGSPILSVKPLVIDLNRYRDIPIKNKGKKSMYDKIEEDSGYFRLVDVFTNDSAVLQNASGGGYFIRLYFNRKIVDGLRSGDIFKLKIEKSPSTERWVFTDISGCYLPCAEEFKRIGKALCC